MFEINHVLFEIHHVLFIILIVIEVGAFMSNLLESRFMWATAHVANIGIITWFANCW
jgi:hypothetical protein